VNFQGVWSSCGTRKPWLCIAWCGCRAVNVELDTCPDEHTILCWPLMSSFKRTNYNQKQILSDYVIQMKGAFLSKGVSSILRRWQVSILNFIFVADTDSENTVFLINNQNVSLGLGEAWSGGSGLRGLDPSCQPSRFFQVSRVF